MANAQKTKINDIILEKHKKQSNTSEYIIKSHQKLVEIKFELAIFGHPILNLCSDNDPPTTESILGERFCTNEMNHGYETLLS